MQLGKIIKKIRIAKNMTASNLSKNIMDKSNYWRFEQGYVKPSIETFLHLILKLNVTFDEFNKINMSKDLKKYHYIYSELSAQHREISISYLSVYIDELHSLFSKNNYVLFKHLAIFCELIKKEKLNLSYQHELNVIKQYLLDCDLWNSYELKLFEDFFWYFSLEDILLLHPKIDINIKQSIILPDDCNVLKSKLLLNIKFIIFCLKKERLNEALIAKKKIEDVNFIENVIEINILLYWIDGILFFIMNDAARGKLHFKEIHRQTSIFKLKKIKLFMIEYSKLLLSSDDWNIIYFLEKEDYFYGELYN